MIFDRYVAVVVAELSCKMKLILNNPVCVTEYIALSPALMSFVKVNIILS